MLIYVGPENQTAVDLENKLRIFEEKEGDCEKNLKV